MQRFTTTLLLGSIFLGLLAFALQTPVLAVDNINALLKDAAGSEGAGYNVSTDDTTLTRIIGGIVRIFLSLLGVIFVILIIYAGLLWMTSAGNEEKITKAKQIMSAAIVGLVIVLSAWAIYVFIMAVLSTLGSGGAGPAVTTG